MVSLLGRDDGLGHTLKFCLFTCYIKLRVKIQHCIFTEKIQTLLHFPFSHIKMPYFKAFYCGYLHNTLILNVSHACHVATIRANLDQDPGINYINYFVLTVPDLFQFDGD